MILIDPPMWPAHRKLFSHLVSDTSLEQLHTFADLAGIPDAAFDGDHYDVPESRHGQLVEQGAVPVSAGELIRRLRASGLRVPARERPSHVLEVLRQRWQRTLPDAPQLGEELLHRWSEPHRRYHTPVHLLDVLIALERLCAPASPPAEVVLAAWFHDAVYEGAAGADERASARLAADCLAGGPLAGPPVPGFLTVTSGSQVEMAAEVERLVLLTKDHSPEPGDAAGALISDADLAVLGRSPAGYQRYVAAVRSEYAHVSDSEWRMGRAAVLRHLLARAPLFHTREAGQSWEESARANLTRELAGLDEPG